MSLKVYNILNNYGNGKLHCTFTSLRLEWPRSRKQPTRNDGEDTGKEEPSFAQLQPHAQPEIYHMPSC